MKKTILLNVVLCSLLPVIILFNANRGKLEIHQILFPLLVVIFISLLSWVVFRWITGSETMAALMVSPLVIIMMSYGMLYDVISHYYRGTPYHGVLVLTSLLIIAGIFFYYAKRIHPYEKKGKLIYYINWIAFIMIAINVMDVGVNQSSARYNEPHEGVDVHFSNSKWLSSKPDVYYIILDEYASIDQIKADYNYDNESFVGFLEEMGFFVARKSRTPSLQTNESLASSLNMENVGLNGAASSAYPSSRLLSSLNNEVIMTREQKKFAGMVRDNKVVQIFKRQGYKYINLGSWWYATRYNKNADVNLNGFGFQCTNEFSAILIQSSILRLVFIDKEYQRKAVLYAFDTLKKVHEIEGPKFIFAHIICPHAPYVFGPNGEKVPFKDAHNMSDQSFYLNQYIFMTKKVEELVQDILLHSKKKPIIIIQSDHGNRIKVSELSYRILNAVYLPQGGRKIFSDSLSPTDTFKIILGQNILSRDGLR